MVEFALAGGLFFFLIFSIANAGFFLFGRGGVEHAADVGAATIAAEGACTGSGGICATPPAGCVGADADQVGICRMDAAGLNTTLLISVSRVDLYRILQQNGAPVSTCSSAEPSVQNTGSLPCVDTTCNATGAAPDNNGSTPCHDQYTSTGAAVGTLVWPCGSIRNVTSSGADFAELTVSFTYHLIAYPGTFTVTTTNVFRLEPQTTG